MQKSIKEGGRILKDKKTSREFNFENPDPKITEPLKSKASWARGQKYQSFLSRF